MLVRVIAASLLIAACSSTPEDPTDIGFNKPVAVMQAYTFTNHAWVAVGAPDLSCLGTAATDMPTTVPVTLATVVHDYQTSIVVPSATVTTFDRVSLTPALDTATADATGNVTVHIPVGHTRIGWKVVAADQMDTLVLNEYFEPTVTNPVEPSQIPSFSNMTAAALPALLGKVRAPGTGIVSGTVRDCGQNALENYIAAVSSTSGVATPIAGSETYYISPDALLPVQHSVRDASSLNGLFATIQIPTTQTAYVQAWGYANDADLAADHLTLLSELAVPVLADTVITGVYDPIRH